jgi:hypothetical protein
MKKMIVGGLAAGAVALGLAAAGPATAHADEMFLACPDGYTADRWGRKHKGAKMKKLLATLAVTLAPLLALLGFVVPAHADVSWIAPCPEEVYIPTGFQHSGVGNDHTTCSFAENVRLGFAAHPGWTVVAPSPVTGEFYTMDCRRVPGTLPNGVPVENVRCQGGNDAVVGLW